jgi:hypothetical protein
LSALLSIFGCDLIVQDDCWAVCLHSRQKARNEACNPNYLRLGEFQFEARPGQKKKLKKQKYSQDPMSTDSLIWWHTPFIPASWVQGQSRERGSSQDPILNGEKKKKS